MGAALLECDFASSNASLEKKIAILMHVRMFKNTDVHKHPDVSTHMWGNQGILQNPRFQMVLVV